MPGRGQSRAAGQNRDGAVGRGDPMAMQRLTSPSIPHRAVCLATIPGESGLQKPCFILEGRSKIAAPALCAATLLLAMGQAVATRSWSAAVCVEGAMKVHGRWDVSATQSERPCPLRLLLLRARRFRARLGRAGTPTEPWPAAWLSRRQGSGAVPNGDLVKRGNEWRDQVPRPVPGQRHPQA
jgi:hypothetical protein